MSDKDLKKEYIDFYEEAHNYWDGYYAEAKNDLDMYHGNQWPQKMLDYLTLHDRQAFTFPSVRRIVHVVSGYEQKNLTSMKYGPIGMEDDKVCDQYTRIVQMSMSQSLDSGYDIMSDAFKMGCLVTGSNLVEFYPDRNNCLRFARWAHNECLLDPGVRNVSLSDCNALITAKMLPVEVAMRLAPQADISQDAVPGSKMGEVGGIGTFMRFNDLALRNNTTGRPYYLFEQWFRRIWKDEKYFLDLRTGEEMLLKDWKREQITALKRMYDPEGDKLRVITKPRKTVRLDIFYGGNHVWGGEDPYRCGDLNFCWFPGYFSPEEHESKYKLQGIVRCDRDAQIVENMQLSQVIDMFESQITTGDLYEEDSLVDPESAYKAGQGHPTIFKTGKLATGYAKRQVSDIPPGMFQILDTMLRHTVELPGINNELFGTEEKDIPGILSKYRQGGALTTLHELFRNMRRAKKAAGLRMIPMIQGTHSPKKILRMLNESPAKGFYDKDANLYDCSVQEGMHTETQRQTAFMQWMDMRAQGFPIPIQAIMDVCPFSMKDELKKYMVAAEQEQSKTAQMQTKIDQLTQQLAAAQVMKKLAEADSEQAESGYRRAKTAAEIQKIEADRMGTLVNSAVALENARQGMTRR